MQIINSSQTTSHEETRKSKHHENNNFEMKQKIGTWLRRRRRQALSENGTEETVSARNDELLRGINQFGKPTIVVIDIEIGRVVVSESGGGTIVGRGLRRPLERPLPELPSRSETALFSCRRHQR